MSTDQFAKIIAKDPWRSSKHPIGGYPGPGRAMDHSPETGGLWPG